MIKRIITVLATAIALSCAVSMVSLADCDNSAADVKLLDKGDLNGDDKLSVSAAAAKVGFNDPLYFSRVFRKNTGMSPSEYRKQILNHE